MMMATSTTRNRMKPLVSAASRWPVPKPMMRPSTSASTGRVSPLTPPPMSRGMGASMRPRRVASVMRRAGVSDGLKVAASSTPSSSRAWRPSRVWAKEMLGSAADADSTGVMANREASNTGTSMKVTLGAEVRGSRLLSSWRWRRGYVVVHSLPLLSTTLYRWTDGATAIGIGHEQETALATGIGQLRVATQHTAAGGSLGGREGHGDESPPAPSPPRLFRCSALGARGRRRGGTAGRARRARAGGRRVAGAGRARAAGGRRARAGAGGGRAPVLVGGAVEVLVPTAALELEAGAAHHAAERGLGTTRGARLRRRIAGLLQYVDRLFTGAPGVFVDGHGQGLFLGRGVGGRGRALEVPLGHAETGQRAQHQLRGRSVLAADRLGEGAERRHLGPLLAHQDFQLPAQHVGEALLDAQVDEVLLAPEQIQLLGEVAPGQGLAAEALAHGLDLLGDAELGLELLELRRAHAQRPAHPARGTPVLGEGGEDGRVLALLQGIHHSVLLEHAFHLPERQFAPGPVVLLGQGLVQGEAVLVGLQQPLEDFLARGARELLEARLGGFQAGEAAARLGQIPLEETGPLQLVGLLGRRLGGGALAGRDARLDRLLRRGGLPPGGHVGGRGAGEGNGEGGHVGGGRGGGGPLPVGAGPPARHPLIPPH